MKINNPSIPFLLQSTLHTKINNLRLSVLLTTKQLELFAKLPTVRKWAISSTKELDLTIYSSIFNEVPILKSDTLREFLLHLYSLSILRIERFNVNTPQEFIYFYYNDVFKLNYQSKLVLSSGNSTISKQAIVKHKTTYLTLNTFIPLGKYKGTTVKEIAKQDKKYLKWFLSYWTQELKNTYDPFIDKFLLTTKNKKQFKPKPQKTYIPYVRGYSNSYFIR
jgi:hypothetical protein